MKYKVQLVDKRDGYKSYATHGSGGVNTSFNAGGKAGGAKTFTNRADAERFIAAAKYSDYRAKVVQVQARKSPGINKRQDGLFGLFK